MKARKRKELLKLLLAKMLSKSWESDDSLCKLTARLHENKEITFVERQIIYKAIRQGMPESTLENNLYFKPGKRIRRYFFLKKLMKK